MERSGPPVRLPDAFADYQATYMASRNMAPRTRVEHSRDVSDLIEFLRSDANIDDPDRYVGATKA